MDGFFFGSTLMFMIHEIFCFSVGKTKSLKRITNSVPDDGFWNNVKYVLLWKNSTKYDAYKCKSIINLPASFNISSHDLCCPLINEL